MMSRLVNGWRGFWKDFDSNQEWIFPELPPTQLQKSFGVHWVLLDRSEFLRAEWMWSRKPKWILGEGGGGYALLVFVALLLLLVPHIGILLTVAWCFAVLCAIARDIVRSTRWRREYEVSIIRILRGNRNLK